MELYLTRAHERLYKKISNNIYALEHFRIPAQHGYIHTAVVVLRDGRCFVGRSICSPRDQYVRRIGYTIAVGRALRAASSRVWDFALPVPLSSGRELRDDVRIALIQAYPDEFLVDSVDPENTLGNPDAWSSNALEVSARPESARPLLEQEQGGDGETMDNDVVGLKNTLGNPKRNPKHKTPVEHFTLPADIYHFRCPNCNNDHPKSDMGGICKTDSRILVYSWSAFSVSEIKGMLQKWRETESEARLQTNILEELLLYGE